jgi:hypothetical protein
MIQRYNFETDDDCGVIPIEDNDGKWVKYDDIKHLMPFQEELEKYLEKDIERLINGTSTLEPIGIMSIAQGSICLYTDKCIVFCNCGCDGKDYPDCTMKDELKAIETNKNGGQQNV